MFLESPFSPRVPWLIPPLSRNLRKVSILLHALSQADKKITYYALDLSISELERTLSHIPDSLLRNITCFGLHGTYDDGLKWLTTNPLVKNKKKCILWLGSSIGNFDRPDATSFLRMVTDTALSVGDFMLIGIDGCKDDAKVWRAYNDSQGVTREFELNGLRHANRILGEDVFEEGAWDYVGKWNAIAGTHEAYFVALKDMVISKAAFGRGEKGIVSIRKGEEVRIERSYKFDETEVTDVWEGAGLVEATKWSCGDLNYSEY